MVLSIFKSDKMILSNLEGRDDIEPERGLHLLPYTFGVCTPDCYRLKKILHESSK